MTTKFAVKEPKKIHLFPKLFCSCGINHCSTLKCRKHFCAPEKSLESPNLVGDSWVWSFASCSSLWWSGVRVSRMMSSMCLAPRWGGHFQVGGTVQGSHRGRGRRGWGQKKGQTDGRKDHCSKNRRGTVCPAQSELSFLPRKLEVLQITESQKLSGWERPPRSSPTFDHTHQYQLNHGTECHMQLFQYHHLLPGQPLLMLNNSFHEEILCGAQPEPPLSALQSESPFCPEISVPNKCTGKMEGKAPRQCVGNRNCKSLHTAEEDTNNPLGKGRKDLRLQKTHYLNNPMHVGLPWY